MVAKSTKKNLSSINKKAKGPTQASSLPPSPKRSAKKASVRASKSPKDEGKGAKQDREKVLREILLSKRHAIIQDMKERLGQSLTEEQHRRLEAAKDSGDQSLAGLEREMGISLQEMRNKERRMIEEALASLDEGNYGICAECGTEISEKRLQALPFARLCVECKTNLELMEKIQNAEPRI